MRVYLLVIGGLLSALPLPEALGFDPATHTAMTSEAVANSNFTRDLNVGPLLKRLGIFDYSPAFTGNYPGLGTRYVDVGSLARFREGMPPPHRSVSIEESVMAAVRNGDPTLAIPAAYTITGWFMRGAIREDDNPVETADSDEPGGVFSRVYGHFFDTASNRGLTVLGLPMGDRAVDWALSPTATVGLLGRTNHFKVSDAREAMWRALTLKTLAANGTLADDVWPTDWQSATREELRKAYWATTFRALGDVVHLLQDMAQPQHTRNDSHSGFGCVSGVGCAAGHSSFFEQYLKARTLQSGFFSLDESLFPPAPPGARRDTTAAQLVYEGNSKPTFNSYADFFATATGAGNSSGNGLANFSNRGFYSFGTNINSASAILSLPSPSPLGIGLGTSWVSETSVPPLKDMTDRPLIGSIAFKSGTVRDTVTGLDEPNVKLAAVGAWDQFLKQVDPSESSYTLNYYNYDEQARLLVPRAVAYSAGLIDYFFRGEMTIGLPDSGVYALVDHADFAGDAAPATDALLGFKGFAKIRLKLQNTTPAITVPGGATYSQAMGAGTLVAVVKFHRNRCYRDDLAGQAGAPGVDMGTCRSPVEEIVVSQPKSVLEVPSDAPKEYEFTFDQEVPINAMDAYLQVVFRGVLGQEQDAVAVATRDISEPAYFTYVNASDYVRIGTRVYTRPEIAASSALIDLVSPTSCKDENGQLRDTCLQPFPMSSALTFWRGGSATPGTQVSVAAMPSVRLYRLAFLTDIQGATRVSQTGNCLPLNDVQIGPFHSQSTPQANGSVISEYDIASPMRGVYGWKGERCVVNGDGNTPGTPAENILEMQAMGNPRPYKFDSITVPPLAN